MVRHGSIATCRSVEPDFVAARGLPVERESTGLQLSNDFSVAKPCETAHLRSDHDGVVTPFARARQVGNAIAFAPSFDQFPGNVAGDL